MDGGIIVLGLLFLLGKGGKGSASKVSTPAELLKRATQASANAWVPYFLDVGEPPAIADALARLAGIESGGNATAVSSLGERGLLQVGTQTQSEGGITQKDWDALVSHDTLPNEHARIASNYAKWLFLRATKHLSQIPTNGNDQIWYAYAYHQYPKDFTAWGQLPSDAASAAEFLKKHASGNSQLAKRIAATNIVAFGIPDIAPSS